MSQYRNNENDVNEGYCIIGFESNITKDTQKFVFDVSGTEHDYPDAMSEDLEIATACLTELFSDKLYEWHKEVLKNHNGLKDDDYGRCQVWITFISEEEFYNHITFGNIQQLTI